MVLKVLPRLGNFCTVHRYHRPVPLRSVQHHIYPKEWGGETKKANLVWVCDTGHYNIHTILDQMIKTASDRRLKGWNKNEWSTAREGFTQMRAKGQV